MDWKKPTACDSNTKLGALFSRLNAKRDRVEELPMELNEPREDVEQPAAPAEHDQQQYQDYGMDFDDFDVS